MFGMGMPEIIVILVVALIVIGPKKLPDLAKSLGKALNEFRRATTEIKDSFIAEAEIRPVVKHTDNVEKSVQENKSREMNTSEKANPEVHTSKPAGSAQDSREPDKNA